MSTKPNHPELSLTVTYYRKPHMSRMIIACGLSLLFVTVGIADDSAFKVGFAKRDITPQGATPMWGYGARHAMLSQGTADPLQAKAVVIEAGILKTDVKYDEIIDMSFVESVKT